VSAGGNGAEPRPLARKRPPRDEQPRRDEQPQKPPLSAAEIESEISRVHLLLPFLNNLKLEELGEQYSNFDTVAPLFDPTGWMRSHRSVELNRDIVRSLSRAKREIAKLLAEAGIKVPS
jgi:hypothetical protein